MKDNVLTDVIYGKLHKRIILAFVTGWIFVTMIELVMGFVLEYTGVVRNMGNYLFRYVTLPAVTDGLIIAITLLIASSDKVAAVVKNYAYCISLVMMVTVLTTVHNYFYIVSALYLATMFCSCIFLDKKLLRFTSILSLVCILLTIPAADWYEGRTETDLERLKNILIMTVLMVVCYMIADILVAALLERENIFSRLRNDKANLERKVRIDGLTGLLNHTSFYEDLENSLRDLRQQKRPFMVAMIDIDNFKIINDTYGHNMGDDILRLVARTMYEESGSDATSFRYGGDEFAMIFFSDDTQLAYSILENIRNHIVDESANFSKYIRVNLSIGLYQVSDPKMSGDDAFRRADEALYEAKRQGKGCVVIGR